MRVKRFQLKYNQRGFTLIEILVVVGIVGLIASIALSSLSLARKMARDKRRLSDVRVIQQALSLYYFDHGQFPISGDGSDITVMPDNSWSNSNSVGSWDRLYQDLKPYINKLPQDPLQSSSGWPGDYSGYSYAYYSQSYGCTEQWYMLVYRLEIARGPDPGSYACGIEWQYGGDGADTFIKTIGFIK